MSIAPNTNVYALSTHDSPAGDTAAKLRRSSGNAATTTVAVFRCTGVTRLKSTRTGSTIFIRYN